jgi:DNA-binding transcriptional regulator PaaX
MAKDKVGDINDALVLEAIQDGDSATGEIIDNCYVGLSESCVEKALRRLMKKGSIIRVAKGEFRLSDDFDKKH